MKANYLLDDGALGDAISKEVLQQNGILTEVLALDKETYQAPLDALKADRGYVEQDEVKLLPDMENLDAICAKFKDEHHHDDDEVRFVLDGEGIFDLRDKDDRWMRVHVEQGDLIVVPKDLHHRFFLTDQNFIHCVRLFKDTAGWVPHYRHPATSNA